MRPLDFLCPALLTLSACVGESEAARKPADSLLLSNVKTLTLRKDLKTSHRRVSAVPQVSVHHTYRPCGGTLTPPSLVEMHRW